MGSSEKLRFSEQYARTRDQTQRLVETLEQCLELVDLYAFRGADGAATAMLRVLVGRERAKALAPSLPVFKRGDGQRFEIGEPGRLHTTELGLGALIAWTVLDGRADDANELLDRLTARSVRRGDKTRKQLKRLAASLEATSQTLATEVRAIKTARADGVVSMPRPPRVVTR